ncbi:lytic transglycosylase domain-containing protein [Sulfurimonas sp. SAG-AH-194-I05]|nr:lytic transglycosylase domain-containing protein [Sulfurimonas sp. SAG-AH-194-I05]MDF1875833.1 lytic transglycosylase domain-containing protein [Sulfurimonas sp. SAG-AH-194-I05]
MIQKILLLSLASVCVYAEIHFKDIESKPAGRAKNFMIWQYLKQNITSQEADNAYALVEGNIWKIKKRYLKKSPNKKILRDSSCRGRKNLLSIEEDDCFNLAVNPFKTLNLDKKTRESILKRLKSKALINLIKIQAEPFREEHYQAYDPNVILNMYLRTTTNHRRKNLNIHYSKKFIQYVFSKDASVWKKFTLLKKIVNDDKLNKLQKSILQLDGKNLGSDSNFLLALNQLRFGSSKKAIKHLEISKQKAQTRMNADKSVFWSYLASEDEKYLQDLALSTDINIYSQFAREKLNIETKNYFSSVDVTHMKNTKDICNPFVWNEIKNEIKNTPKDQLITLANKYNQKNMKPVQGFILEKANDFKKQSYLMPYNEYLSGISNERKALVYALMRQESNLIPSALSRSFALGLMQIMPFVTDDLSKRMKNPITCYDDMFQPSYNIRYALKHLDWLDNTFYHPLFIAYAYNGGLGYFRKHLKANTFTKGKYEPYLSLELMSNKESREYGKKVLSNYVVYKKILKEDVSIIDLLNSLTDPKKTDRYRSSK